MTNREKWNRLSVRLEEIAAYQRAIGKLQFDRECCAPEEGLEQAGEDMAMLGRQLYRLTHAKTYRDLICQLQADGEGLDPVERRAVEQRFRIWQREKDLSAAFCYERDRAFNRAYGDWLRAKNAGDFALFRDSLQAVITYTRRTIDKRERRYDSYYQACLDDNEPGGSEAQLDAFFAAIKARIVPLLRRIQAEGKPIREDFLTRPCPVDKQEAVSRRLLQLEGLRQSALVLMTTEHPFTETFGPRDVRVTTHYYEENFISNVFSTLHEGGHAMLMQYEPEELFRKHCDNFATNGQHECISRFYENIIGRSEAFLHYILPMLREMSGDTFADVSERELYEAVNIARPGMIRMEADELSYCLHILVRYELEKAMVNGEISVDQVPGLWREKYREYLGVEVTGDDVGCLQDVHWTDGFGYFPSYALGNAYGAQILRTMEKDFDVFAAVREGRLDRIADWLRERVFAIASLKDPDDWIRTITDESLNVNYYLDYLEDKFTRLYKLK
ncbi:MAG: carboxypeptidase M32 [Oscillospiraceae bacterium]|nr:carboxypeptidase M32 [Oscillospiraceae bacterium]